MIINTIKSYCPLPMCYLIDDEDQVDEDQDQIKLIAIVNEFSMYQIFED